MSDLEGHDTDDEGEHDVENCFACQKDNEVRGNCRCGQCCRKLIIEASLADAQREPRIAEKGSPLVGWEQPDGTRKVAAYRLNSREDFACVFLDRDTNLCTIYDLQP